jgi:CheY-like chemotaxis protein
MVFTMTNQKPFGAKAAVTDQGFTSVTLQGNPRVLVVDDEELMVDIVTVMLEEQGAVVTAVTNGQEAVKVYGEKHAEIDCIFLDYSMPGLSGWEAYQAMKKVNPKPPVLFVSGLQFIPEIDQAWKSGEAETLMKPFHEVELVKSINRVLAKTPKG